jgi:hypothetical protein
LRHFLVRIFLHADGLVAEAGIFVRLFLGEDYSGVLVAGGGVVCAVCEFLSLGGLAVGLDFELVLFYLH